MTYTNLMYYGAFGSAKFTTTKNVYNDRGQIVARAVTEAIAEMICDALNDAAKREESK